MLYFKYFLQWDDDLATSIYHTFVALCYLTPILGAIVADSWLGKFKSVVGRFTHFNINFLVFVVQKTCNYFRLKLMFLFPRTIIYLSVVYAIGQVALAVSAIHDITDSDRDGTPNNMTFHV